ncbi:MAG: transglycosylase SLT domain-containing protein [Deltaproteobacteria bacterium]|nr:transglycosylase SLT domain-containing protein [Deltaproteobacteria bacterium]MBT8465589.1 transglycosylase SLT domain-containing protein [Deltaproteobacteria bacterium]NNK07686.1 transglycosylase SLT domain-containing protein [Myxococcales bacterium]NNK42163.1 transglycosylase SLT domain-containing protein [Myxococcales bacterium]
MRFVAPRRFQHPALVALLLCLACSKSEPAHTASGAARESHAHDIRGAADNTRAQNKDLARYMIRKTYAKWNGSAQFQCLDRLWTKESHWNHRAVNKRTGACGIPQSYPCDKMKKMGDRYGVSHRRNPWPQIAWGLQYIDERYGTPCTAWKRFLRGGGY